MRITNQALQRFCGAPARHARLFGACMLAGAALFSVSANAQEDKVFFCPPSVITGLSKPSNGIMCDAERCFSSQSAELTPEQKAFLLSSGTCRYLSDQEVANYWLKSASTTQRASK